MADTGEIDAPPGSDEAERVPLVTPLDVQREMANVYRAARFSRIKPERANSLTQTLAHIGKLAEANADANLEQRLAALEAQAAAH